MPIHPRHPSPAALVMVGFALWLGCDPGPDTEFEDLLTDDDRIDRTIAADKKEPV